MPTLIAPERRCTAGFARTTHSWLACLSFTLLLLSLLLPAEVFGYGGPPSPAGGLNTVPYRSKRTDNRILIMPVQFSGGGGNPLSQAAAQTALDEVDTWFRAASFGNFGFSVRTATTVLTLPNTKAYYTGAGVDTLLTAARAAAAATNAAWAAANFEFDVVIAESGTLPESGSANPGSKGMWLANSVGEPFPKSTFVHELGHNLGLNHAGLWIRPAGSTNPLNPAGSFQDYGSVFDPVGLAGYNRHYSAHYKYLLGWIPESNVATVDSTTTSNVRIYAHDGGTMNPARKYAIRIPASVSDAANPGNRDIWLETRTNFNPGVPVGSRDGLIVKWGDQRGSEQGSCDLDLTPNSLAPNNNTNDFADAILPVGTLFADPWQAAAGTNRLTVTPVGSGGAGADKYVDVAITTPNADLTALSFSAGALSPTFSASTAGYTITALGATSTTVTPSAAAGATIQVRINGGSFTTVASGATSGALPLFTGSNMVDVKVTNGGWVKTYTVSIPTATAIPAVTASLGSIPDAPASGVEGTARDVQFTVSGMSGTLSAVVVDFTLNPPHSFATDVTARLIAPNGTTTHTVVSFTNQEKKIYLAGPYAFADDVPAASLLSTVVAGTASGGTAAAGRYRTQTNSGAATSLVTTFSPITGAAINGTWTLRFTDRFRGDTGTVGAANLYFVTSSPVVVPTVTTAAQSDVTSTSAVLGGNVTADGGSGVTDRGIVWATTATPTTANNKVANGTGTGSFSGPVTGFTAGSTLYVRAYAVNSAGTAYGNQISFTTPAAVPLPSGAVSWYQAETNASDSLGRNHATTTAATYTDGRAGQAFSITGVAGSHVNCTNNPSLQLSTGTVEAWIKTGSATGYRGIMVKPNAYGLFLENNVLIGYDWGGGGGLVSTSSLADNAWHHVALTFTPGSMEVYADGVLKINRTSFAVSNQNSPLVLGAGDAAGGIQNFNGLIDEATIYNRVLSGAEIQSIFSAGAAGKFTSANADLASLSTTAGALSPAFAAAVTAYTASVPNATAAITVTPVTSHAGATVQARVNGGAYAAVTSGSASGTMALNVGTNSVEVKVTAENITTTKTCTITVARASATVALPSGAVSWYKAENNAQDSVGANHATAAATTYAAGKVGQGFSLTGAANSYLNCTNNASLKLATGTVEAWIKTSASGAGSSFRGIIVKQSAYGLFLENNTLIGYDWVNTTLPSTVNLGNNAWHHVALTFTTGAMTLYADGAQVATRTNFAVLNQNNALVLGAGDATGLSQNFNGQIDEATIYNRVLSAAEIQSIFTAGAGGKITQAAVPLATVNFSRSGGDMVFGFTSLNGLSYTLWRSDNLQSWTNTGIPAIPGDGTAKSFTLPDPSATIPRRYFRVQVQ